MSTMSRIAAAAALSAILAAPAAAQINLDYTASAICNAANGGKPLVGSTLVGSVGCQSATFSGSLTFSPISGTIANIADGTYAIGTFKLAGVGGTMSNQVNFLNSLFTFAFNMPTATSGGTSSFTAATNNATINDKGNTSASGIALTIGGGTQTVNFTTATGSGSFMLALGVNPNTPIVRSGGSVATPAAAGTRALEATISGYTFTANPVPPTTATPEPATVSLMAGGLLALGVAARRRRQA